VLRRLSLCLQEGEILCLLGRNGAGKTTILKSVMGLVRCEGNITLDGQPIGQMCAHEIPAQGIGYVPQGRRLFSELTVEENLDIGLMVKKQDRKILNAIFDLFPVLRERLKQESGTLSGGEQQMLAMARALCIRPKVLLLDEPTEGLMPSMITNIREVVRRLRHQGVGILLVEQRVEAVLSVADRVAFVENGAIQQEVTKEELERNPQLLKQYVGI